jgi:hypothetical protein
VDFGQASDQVVGEELAGAGESGPDHQLVAGELGGSHRAGVEDFHRVAHVFAAEEGGEDVDRGVGRIVEECDVAAFVADADAGGSGFGEDVAVGGW